MRTETINLQMPFPVVDFGMPVYYHTKVQKPSALSYILLVYIKRGIGERILADNIAEAGIKGDMTELINDELYHLIHIDKMVEYVGQVPEDFDIWRKTIIHNKTKDFRLTALGEKLFRDQFVPVGGMHPQRRRLAFNPMKRKFYSPQGKRMDSFDDLLGTDSFKVEEPEMTEEMAIEYLNSVKESLLKLEKQEIVTKIDDLSIEQQVRATYQDIRLEIDSYGVAFFCEDSEYLDYLTKQYKPQWIEHILIGNTERLGLDQPVTIPIGNIGNTEQIVLPKNIKARHKDKSCRHLIWTDDILKSGELKAEAKDILKLDSEQVDGLCRRISPLCVGALLTEDGKLHAYEAVNLEIPKKGSYGMTIHLDALLDNTIEGEKRYRYLSDLGTIMIDREWSLENIKTELWLSGLDASGFHLEKYVDSQFQKQSDLTKRLDMIEEAMQLNDVLLSSVLRMHAGEILQQLQQEFSLKDLPDTIGLLKRLVNILDSDIVETITAVIGLLKQPYSKDQLLQTLLDADVMSEGKALELSNIVPSYIKRIIDGEQIDGSHRMAIQAKRIQNALHTLCGMIGIQNDPINYYPRKIEDPMAFQNSLDTLVGNYRDFKNNCTQSVSNEYFETLDSYYTAIVDFSYKRAGEKNIDQYSREDFIMLLERSPEECVLKLQRRLEVDLRSKLRLDENDTTPLAIMLNKALDTKWLTEEELQQLLILKEVRNGLTHAAKADMTYLDPDKTIETVLAVTGREHPIESKSQPTKGRDEEAPSKALTKRVDIKYPHKREYLMETFKRDHARAIKKLKECECFLLEAISGKKIDSTKDMDIELNNARTKKILSEETAAKIVEFNRAWKARNIKAEHFNDFRNWMDALLSIKYVEIPIWGKSHRS